MDKMTSAPEHLRHVFGWMLAELGRERLEVVLAPAPDPRHSSHKVRAVSNENPWWYKELCNRYPSRSKSHRRWRTRIKRRETLNALRRLYVAGGTYSHYADDLIELAEDVLQSAREEEKNYEERLKRQSAKVIPF